MSIQKKLAQKIRTGEPFFMTLEHLQEILDFHDIKEDPKVFAYFNNLEEQITDLVVSPDGTWLSKKEKLGTIKDGGFLELEDNTVINSSMVNGKGELYLLVDKKKLDNKEIIARQKLEINLLKNTIRDLNFKNDFWIEKFLEMIK